MWPSRETASFVYDAANWGLILGLIIGVVATIFIIWMGNVKEGYLKRDIAESNERASKANAEAAKANEGLAGSNEKIAAAEQRVGEANKRTQELAMETEELKRKNLETESRLEKERLDRLNMEVAIAPRIMEQQQSAKELERFKGMSVIIESLAESEPWRTAGQIAWTLERAGWNVQRGMSRYLDGTGFFDGVTAETNVGSRPADDRSIDASEALVAVLAKNNIKAHRRPHMKNLPPNTVVVRVGLKPAEYFSRDRKDKQYGNMLYK